MSFTDATWIGSRLTVQIDQVIRTIGELPLSHGGQLAFVVDVDGSALINGTQVDAETPGLWPVEQGKRYLFAGAVRELGRFKDKQFLPYEIWLEPSLGAPLRGPAREKRFPNDPGYQTVPTFEQDDIATDMLGVTERLQQEVSKRRSTPRR